MVFKQTRPSPAPPSSDGGTTSRIPQTEAEVADALRALDAERASLAETIERHAEREQAALEAGAEDYQLAELDWSVRRAKVRLVQLERQEAGLVELGKKLRFDAQAAQWDALRAEYAAAGEQLVRDARALSASHARVAQLAQRCDDIGFRGPGVASGAGIAVMEPLLPRPPFLPCLAALAGWEIGAKRAAASTLHPVKPGQFNPARPFCTAAEMSEQDAQRMWGTGPEQHLAAVQAGGRRTTLGGS